mmetsp:Transcript_95253/g.274346  ORF Transcript_95253/g.274346 Transcript_95253/m.274346 type:complete len:259 (+) Transcript_95253:996-1772(+)
MRTHDHMSVRMPPMVPRIMTFNSLKTSSLIKRKTLKTRNNRTILNRDSTWPLLMSAWRLITASTISKIARAAKDTSKRLKKRSGPQKYLRKPWMHSLIKTSAVKMKAKSPSMASQPIHWGAKSQLTPSDIVLATIANPKKLSIHRIRRSDSRTSVAYAFMGCLAISAFISLMISKVDSFMVSSSMLSWCSDSSKKELIFEPVLRVGDVRKPGLDAVWTGLSSSSGRSGTTSPSRSPRSPPPPRPSTSPSPPSSPAPSP